MNNEELKRESLLKVDLDVLAEERITLDKIPASYEHKKFEQLPVQVEVIFGRTILPLGKIAALGPGALLPFDQSEDQGVEIYANGTLVAQGEIVAVGDRFGAKITSFY